MRRDIFLSILLMLFFKVGFCQINTSTDSMGVYIKRLSWVSFQLTPTYFHQVVLGNEAQKIVDNTTDTVEVVRRLLNEIYKKEKSVSIHIILSKMFEPGNNKFTESYVYRNDSIAGINYSYNAITWQYHAQQGKFTIEPEAVNKIKEYWEKKLALFLNKSTIKKESE